MEIEGLLVVGFLILPAIIYFIVRGAVEEGVLRAFIQFEEYKNNNEKSNHKI
jgi:hypothetical protein